MVYFNGERQIKLEARSFSELQQLIREIERKEEEERKEKLNLEYEAAE